MSISRVHQVFATLIGLLIVINSSAQESELKEWSGTLKREGKQKESITFNVKISGEGAFITKMIYADTPFKIKRQKFKGDTLSFYWTPGNDDVRCDLKETGNKYEGECLTEESDNRIKIRINPGKQFFKASNSEAKDAQGGKTKTEKDAGKGDKTKAEKEEGKGDKAKAEKEEGKGNKKKDEKEAKDSKKEDS